MIFHIVLFLALGMAVGTIAWWWQRAGVAMGWVAPVAFGIAGAVAGGSIAAALYRGEASIVFIMATAGAVAVVLVAEAVARRRVRV